MKILFTRFPLESAYGGAEIQTLSLMKGLALSGHQIEFLGNCPTLLEKCAEYFCDKLDIGSPPVTKWLAVSFLWRKKTMQRRLLKHINDPDAVFMLSMSEKLLATEHLHKKGIKVFWVEHDRIGPWLTRNPWLPMLKQQSRYAEIIAVSELSKKMYVDIGFDKKRIHVIPNGIDLHRFEESNSQFSIPRPIRTLGPFGRVHSQLRIGCVARLSKEKGIDVLIDAITDIPNCTLTIIGSGPEEGYLRKLIIDRELTDRVAIDTHQKDLSQLYNSIDLFALPSREHDPFGLVAAEAMSLGIPTIITESCGIASHLKNKTHALVVPAESSTKLEAAINWVIKHTSDAVEMANRGKKHATERFSDTRMVDEYRELLKRFS